MDENTLHKTGSSAVFKIILKREGKKEKKANKVITTRGIGIWSPSRTGLNLLVLIAILKMLQQESGQVLLLIQVSASAGLFWLAARAAMVGKSRTNARIKYIINELRE